MEKRLYKEMIENLEKLFRTHVFENKKIYLFGHCNATEELADALLDHGLAVVAIMDNNTAKHGSSYRNIIICPPGEILTESSRDVLVCIVSRAYAAMADQLRRMGYGGEIRKILNYNSYAEYSLSQDTIFSMRQRVGRGIKLLRLMKRSYPKRFLVLCPFSALGDIYYMMVYLPEFLRKMRIEKCVVGVVGKACKDVVEIFGTYEAADFRQADMDEMIQAALFTEDRNVFIPHQDRPYIVNIFRTLYVKCIPLEQLYCCGVFGLPASAQAAKPLYLQNYKDLGSISEGKAVILAPCAKSVTTLPLYIWIDIVDSFHEKGYQCYTNVAGEEQPLPGTLPISPMISEIQSVVERAGIFIGIRSGLCDVLRDAFCRKIALYPDYYYSDTKWKAIDMYRLDGWENIVVEEGFRWKEMN
ncbi:MAG TPA: hypothetical protein DCZ91_20455 [Lachnospiraceae bacterium]|nr:hypothetical protein [Lachnospiraceae bacterium]